MRTRNLRSCPVAVKRLTRKSKNVCLISNNEGTDKENIPVNSEKNKKTISSKKTNAEIHPLASTSNTKDNLQHVEHKVLAAPKENKNVRQRNLKKRLASQNGDDIKARFSQKENKCTESVELESVTEEAEGLSAGDEYEQITESAESEKKEIDCNHKNEVFQEENKRKLRSGSNQKKTDKNLSSDNKSVVPEIKYHFRKRVNTNEKDKVLVAPSKIPKKVARKDASVTLKNNTSKQIEKPAVKKISKVNLVKSKPKSYANKNSSPQVKCVKTDVNEMKKTNNIPIYKKDFNSIKANKGIKRRKKVDVYDMDLDEDLIASENELKRKKKICPTSKGKKNNNQSKTFWSTKKDCCVKSSKLVKTKSKIMKEPVVIDAKITDNVDITEQLVEKDKQSDVALDLPEAASEVDLEMGSGEIEESIVTTNHTEDSIYEIESNTVSKPVEKGVELCKDQSAISTDAVTLDCVEVANLGSVERSTNSDSHIFAVPSTEYFSNNVKVPRDINLTLLADELERSFLMPTLTSTPCVQPTKRLKTQARKVIDVSKIPVVNKHSNTTEIVPEPDVSEIPVVNKHSNTTEIVPEPDVSEIPVVNKHSNTTEIVSEPQVNEDINVADTVDHEITLFESPVKPEKQENEGNRLKSPKKRLQLNLFGDFFNSPAKPVDLNETVLKPKKAYHSPDSFKVHLVRAKKKVTQKKEVKKSKQDAFFEKMTAHFDEIDGLELCVERQ